ncbi:MAG: metallophosphoesterase [Desulfosarcinaceae bacterium]|nr:metallophosphoesterase [Desulfosarcinaceae bacterium]
MGPIRILFMADSHLGFDLPRRPRVARRRRGNDFFDSYRRILQAARLRQVDALIHGGDLFYRSRVAPQLVDRVFTPLKRLVDSGIPVFIVPGNHEGGHIPHSELSVHPGLQVFTRPATHILAKAGRTLSISGFPFHRGNIRDRFPELLAATDWQRTAADARLLCLHQSVAGARVGPADYQFRGGREVIRTRDLPQGFAAVLAGHIHRHQVLTRSLGGRALGAPVLYPGAIDRVSFAEAAEVKGYLILTLDLSETPGHGQMQWRFHPLPTRPMVRIDLRPGRMSSSSLMNLILDRIAAVPADAIVQLRLHGQVPPRQRGCLSAPQLRRLAPATMNITAVWIADRERRR